MKAVFTFMLLALCQFAFAQPEFKKTNRSKLPDIIVEKGNSRLVVPIEVKIDGKKYSPDSLRLSISPVDDSCFYVRENAKYVDKQSKVITFYIILKEKFILQKSKIFDLVCRLDGQKFTSSIKLIVKPEPNLIYTKQDYFDDPALELDYVTKIESTNNILTVTGYHKDNNETVVKRQITLKQKEKFDILEMLRPSVSIITVPFKIRPAYDYKTRNFPATAQSGLTNIGANLSLLGIQLDRYKSDASKITRKFGLGVWLAPSVEELDTASLRNQNALPASKKSKQMFVSTGLTLTYSYNSLSFVFVPLGFDMPTSKLGREWIYRGRYWWGFGIAIDPKFFASVLNK